MVARTLISNSHSSLRAPAKQSRLPTQWQSGLLRRGACHGARVRAIRWLLTMTEKTHFRIPATRPCPDLAWPTLKNRRARGDPQVRARGMPDARRAPAASCAKVKRTRVSHHRYSRQPAFPAQWCYGLLRALSGDRAFLPPSSAQCARDITSVRCAASSRVMRGHCRQLGASVEASRPHGFAVRIGAPRQRAPIRPSHSGPRS